MHVLVLLIVASVCVLCFVTLTRVRRIEKLMLQIQEDAEFMRARTRAGEYATLLSNAYRAVSSANEVRLNGGDVDHANDVAERMLEELEQFR